MSRTVWKFPLGPDVVTLVPMPEGSAVLSVQLQGGTPCLWAAVDPAMPVEERRFRIVGTGNPVASGAHFIATFQVPPFVFHVFEDARW